MNFLPLESKETNEPPDANGTSSVENSSFSSSDESDEPEDYIITNESQIQNSTLQSDFAINDVLNISDIANDNSETVDNINSENESFHLELEQSSSEESESVFEPDNTYNDNQSFASERDDVSTPVVPLRRSTRTRQLPESLSSGDYVLT